MCMCIVSVSNVVEFSGAGLVSCSRTNSELNGDIYTSEVIEATEQASFEDLTNFE